MEQTITLPETLEFIIKAHEGQKYGDMDYWRHPVMVLGVAIKTFDRDMTETAAHAALLHDVVEDTEYDLVALREMGYSEKVLSAVALVTKDKALSYEENIQRIVDSGDRDAMMVKFADNWVNFHGDKSDWDQRRAVKSNTKYLKSMYVLGAALGIEVNKLLSEG